MANEYGYELFSSSISCIYHDIQRIERAQMAKYGLKGPHAQCLLAMSRNPGGITAAELCELCEKDKAAISRTVAELEQANMIRRVQNNGKRYRASLLLTPQGQAAAQAVSEIARQAVEQASEGYDEHSRETFYSVLAMIAGSLHTICKNGLQEENQEG